MMSPAREDRKFLWKPWATLIAIVAVFAVLPCGIGRVPPEAITAGRVKKLILACRSYANDNGGRFPEKLELLVPDYIEDRGSLIVAANKGNSKQLLYHSGLSFDSSENDPLIEYPVPINDKRIIGYVGGHVSAEPWEDDAP